jgi:hypothetical protein
VDWIYLAQDKDQRRGLLNTVMKVGSVKSGEVLDRATTSFSRRNLLHVIICLGIKLYVFMRVNNTLLYQ